MASCASSAIEAGRGVLDNIRCAAMGAVGHDRAVPTLVTVLRRRAVLRRRKLRSLKEHGVNALAQIGGPRAAAALDEAGRRGDRMVRKIVAMRRT